MPIFYLSQILKTFVVLDGSMNLRCFIFFYFSHSLPLALTRSLSRRLRCCGLHLCREYLLVKFNVLDGDGLCQLGLVKDWGVIEAWRKHWEVVLRVVWIHIEGVFNGKHFALWDCIINIIIFPLRSHPPFNPEIVYALWIAQTSQQLQGQLHVLCQFFVEPQIIIFPFQIGELLTLTKC